MNWTVIEGSTAISQVGYDSEGRRLIIQSLNGTPYEYQNVPPETHKAFLAAPSKGKAWADIRKSYQLAKGNGTLTVPRVEKPVAPKVEKVAEVEAPVASLAISFEAGSDSIGFPPLPFDQMVVQLSDKMNEFFAPLQSEIVDLVNNATDAQVTDAVSYENAGAFGKKLADLRRTITTKLRPTKQSIDQVKGVVLDKEKELLGIIERGEKYLGKACTSYRVAEQRRAKEAAEAESKRKLKEAEDARIAQAEMAQAAGRTKLAEKLLDTPVTAPKVEVKAAVPTGTGAKGRVNYKWRVNDWTVVPREWLMLDESKIGKHARDNKLPDGTVLNGIEFYTEPDTNF